MTWLTRTPLAVVQAYVEMLDGLHAEEAMNASTAVAVGTGSLKKGQGRSQWSRWERAARGPARVARAASPANTRAMGIGYREVKRGV